MINILLHGCNGRMGRFITTYAAENEDMKIVAGVDPYTGVTNEYPVYASITEVKEKADVIIDFGTASAVDALLDFALANNTPVVLCTTGLSEEQLSKVNEATGKIAILRSANMSLGINTLISILKTVSKPLAEAGFDIEVLEMHHNQKLDAPSGTAIALAEAANEALDNEYEFVYDRSGRREKRPKKEIGISAIRGGSIVGEHDVIFAGTDEVITLHHSAYSRAVFAKGALSAARFLAGKPAGMYGMNDVINA